MGRTKKATSFWLSPEAKLLLKGLAEYHGIPQTGVLEMLIRKEARAEGIAVPPGESDAKSDKDRG